MSPYGPKIKIPCDILKFCPCSNLYQERKQFIHQFIHLAVIITYTTIVPVHHSNRPRVVYLSFERDKCRRPDAFQRQLSQKQLNFTYSRKKKNKTSAICDHFNNTCSLKFAIDQRGNITTNLQINSFITQFNNTL